jgi:hypothetical protein
MRGAARTDIAHGDGLSQGSGSSPHTFEIVQLEYVHPITSCSNLVAACYFQGYLQSRLLLVNGADNSHLG